MLASFVFLSLYYLNFLFVEYCINIFPALHNLKKKFFSNFQVFNISYNFYFNSPVILTFFFHKLSN